MSKQKYKYLSQNILLFSIGSFGQKILAFFLVPLYTNYLTTGEYGTVDIVTTTVSLLLPIFTLNISGAVMRFTISDKDSKNYLTYGFTVMLKGAALFLLVLTLFWFLPVLGDYKNLYPWIYIIFVLNGIYTLQQSYLRAVDKVNVMVMGGLINSVVMMLMNILLLTQIHMGVSGYLISTAGGLLVSVIFMEALGKIHSYLSFADGTYRNTAKECLKYCIPTIFTALAWWINSSLDKYFVTAFCGVDQNGIYSIAYKIPTLLNVFSSIFIQAWTLSSINEFDRSDSEGFFAKMYSLYNVMLVIVCSGIILFNILLSRILYSNEFFTAWHCVPLLLLSAIFGDLAGFFGGIFAAVKDTKTPAYSTMASAVINAVLNFLFIPKMGIIGAAIATMLAYMASWIIRLVVSKRFIKMKVNYIRDIITYVLIGMQAAFAMTESHIYAGQVVIIAIILGINARTYTEAFKQLTGFVKKKLRK